MSERPRRLGPFGVVAMAALLVFALAACASDSPGAQSQSAATPAEPVAEAVVPGFPTGPAVTVPVGYTPPRDRVDSTGAYLPANGKPTLVFVDAIW